MKMAKASEQDVEAALEVLRLLEAASRGWYLDDLQGSPPEFDPDNVKHLRTLHDRLMACMDKAPGGLARVVWGFRTVLANDVVDPDADVLELHPRIKAALNQAAPPPPASAAPPTTV